MTSKNPLTMIRGGGGNDGGWTGQGPAKSLHEFAAELNQRNFVRDQGLEYVVLTRTDDHGEIVEYLERRQIRSLRAWKPSEREIAATNAVVAHHASDPHLTQGEFNRMCERGIVTRQVDRKMSEPVEHAA